MDEKNKSTNSYPSRRSIIRKVGTGALIGTVGIYGTSAQTVASSGMESQAGPEPDEYITAPYGFNSDTEWNTHQEAVEQSLGLALNANNPGEYPIDICYTGEEGEACVKDLGDSFKNGKQPCTSCPGGNTPELNYTTATLQDLAAGVSFDIWIGVDMDSGCLWAGHEASGFAKKFSCDMPQREANRLSEPQKYENPIHSGVESVIQSVKENKEVILVGGLALVAVVAFGPGVATAVVI
jgi:hypothetical protein